LRNFRLIRLVRLLRMYKVVRLLNSLIDMLPSAKLVAVLQMCYLLFGLLLVAHYIACLWCWVAFAHRAQTTWVDSLPGDADIFYQYTSALHWSLTQFMPAPMDIAPANRVERVFAIAVVLSGAVIFSATVGSISAKITEMRHLSFERLNQESRLREYLGNKKVSLDVGNRIWNFMHGKRRGQKSMLRERDLCLLDGIPTGLRNALRCDVFCPGMRIHALFSICLDRHARPALALCHQAMEEFVFRQQEDVFVEEDLAFGMYFVRVGVLKYSTPLYRIRAVKVRAGKATSFLAEASLWGKWMHCGCLIAHAPSELTLVNTKKFLAVLTEDVFDSGLYAALRKYAQSFADLLKVEIRIGEFMTEPMVTDLITNNLAVCKRINKAFDCRTPRDRGESTNSMDSRRHGVHAMKWNSGSKLNLMTRMTRVLNK